MYAEAPCPKSSHGATNHLPVHPWSGYGSSHCRLDSLQIARRGLACPSIGYNVENDLLSLIEDTHASAFDRADVHEDILAAIIRLNEAEAFLVIEPLHGSFCHIALLFRYGCNVAARQRSRFVRDLEKSRQSDAKCAARPSRLAEARWGNVGHGDWECKGSRRSSGKKQVS